MRNLAPIVPVERLFITRRLMEAALPDARLVGHQRHVDSINLPDRDDRHVVAAGIESGASVIVTWNLKDFPDNELARFGLRSQSPDDFLVGLYDQARDAMLISLANARRNLSKTKISPAKFLEALVAQKLNRLASRIARRLGRL
jgi:hypothetical protein